MRIIKKIISILLIVSSFYSSSQVLTNYNKIQEINEMYEIYYNEEAEIKLALIGKDGSLSDGNGYDDEETYKQQFQYVNEKYSQISSEKIIDEMDISYFLQITATNNIVSEKRFKTLNQQILEGRYFTDDEIKNGENVVIINYKEKIRENLKIGDTYVITQYGGEKFAKIETKIIGFYKESDSKDFDKNIDNYIYMPTNAMIEISDIWLENCLDEEYLKYYLPLGILNPIIKCKSEKECDLILELLEEYQKEVTFTFEIVRLDSHKINNGFETISYETNLKHNVLNLISSFTILVFIEITFFVLNRKQQRDYEKRLLEEQEKNIQNVLAINQESRKLKHDLKHFLSHISNLLNEQEIDEAIQLLNEYYQEIDLLEIPAFTHNRTIDLVINNYLQRANKQNIDFTYSSTLIHSLPILDRKLYILLSNALDNAFEHCDEQRKVNLDITNIGNYYRFILVNTTKETTIKKKIIPSKEHGFGTMSMNQILKEIQGEITNEIIDGKYICTILLPIDK